MKMYATFGKLLAYSDICLPKIMECTTCLVVLVSQVGVQYAVLGLLLGSVSAMLPLRWGFLLPPIIAVELPHHLATYFKQIFAFWGALRSWGLKGEK